MKIIFSKNNNYFLERNAGIEPTPRTGMFVFYLLNLFRELNSSASRTRTETILSDQRILSPPCLPIPPRRHYFFKELQYKYNKKFWNFQIIFHYLYCLWTQRGMIPRPSDYESAALTNWAMGPLYKNSLSGLNVVYHSIILN